MIDYPESVHTLGWFPYHPRTTPCPYDGFNQLVAHNREPYRSALNTAFRELFASGNPEPPAAWTSPAHYAAHLATKEFRVALYFDNLHVFRDPNGDLDVTYDAIQGLDYVGFTPVRVRNRVEYKPGRAGQDPGVIKVQGPDAVQLVHRVQVKLGRQLDQGNRVLTGHWAPWAWCELNCTFKSTGGPACVAAASSMPNQTFYRGLAKVAEYKLDTLTSDDVHGFLAAGANNEAPRWSGNDRVI